MNVVGGSGVKNGRDGEANMIVATMVVGVVVSKMIDEDVVMWGGGDGCDGSEVMIVVIMVTVVVTYVILFFLN